MKHKSILSSVLASALVLVSPVTIKAHATPPGTAVANLSQDRDDWDKPPQEFRDAQREGFHDGVEAARNDFDHRRRADVDDHPQYRHPHVSRDLRDDYCEGLRQGYKRATSHLMDNHDHDHDHN
jgi:hypothetical protein